MENYNEKLQNIALELKSMCDEDQAMRLRCKQNPEYYNEEVDRRNTAKMKEIVAEIGWPTISKVGNEGSAQAWLLIQHADHDLEFQKRCLNLMKL